VVPNEIPGRSRVLLKINPGRRSKDVLVSRRKSRELALQILFILDYSNASAKEIFPLFVQSFHDNKELDAFTKHLVVGVSTHQDAIDDMIRRYSEHWSLQRIARVDRNILRIAIFELQWCDDIPPKVSLNEAVELGKKYGTERSSSFINGILDRISHLDHVNHASG